MTTPSIRWAEVDKLIHEPARLAILTILAAVEKADFLYLQRAAELTRGNLSAHLTKLEEGGYIQVEKTYRGKMPLTLVEITPTGRNALENYRHMLKNWLG
jgi:DNA-binding transcriptional ArsR family regulator